MGESKNNERSFKYSAIFFIVIILDLFISFLFGVTCFMIYFNISNGSYHNPFNIALAIILFINLCLDIYLINTLRNSPQSINIKTCWIKSFFGFIGIFTFISGLYFLIISVKMIISSPDREIDQQKRNQKFCTQCGNELPDQVNFCSHCGNPKIPAISEKISISYKCPLCRNPLSTLKIPSDDGEAFKSGWICQVCNAKFDRDLNLLRDPKKESSSYNSGKSLDFMYIVKISGGLLVILLIVLTMAGTAKSGSNLLYGIVFLILSGGIFYEGWKAVKP